MSRAKDGKAQIIWPAASIEIFRKHNLVLGSLRSSHFFMILASLAFREGMKTNMF